MSIHLIPNSPNEGSINLQTRERNDIDNYQSKEFTFSDRMAIEYLDNIYSNQVIYRTDPLPIYNCHGLSFSSRRTSIIDDEFIRLILDDDGYIYVTPEDVLPGDIIMYYDKKGRIEHSGIVISSPNEEQLKIPRIVSKWGKFREVIHWAHIGPYNWPNVKYIRIVR